MRVAKQQGQTPAQLETYLAHLHLLGLQPDEQTFNVLLRAYIAHNNLQGAADVLDRMTDHGELGCVRTCQGWAMWCLSDSASLAQLVYTAWRGLLQQLA